MIAVMAACFLTQPLLREPTQKKKKKRHGTIQGPQKLQTYLFLTQKIHTISQMFASLEAIRPTNAHQDTFPPTLSTGSEKLSCYACPLKVRANRNRGRGYLK